MSDSNINIKENIFGSHAINNMEMIKKISKKSDSLVEELFQANFSAYNKTLQVLKTFDIDKSTADKTRTEATIELKNLLIEKSYLTDGIADGVSILLDSAMLIMGGNSEKNQAKSAIEQLTITDITMKTDQPTFKLSYPLQLDEGTVDTIEVVVLSLIHI